MYSPALECRTLWGLTDRMAPSWCGVWDCFGRSRLETNNSVNQLRTQGTQVRCALTKRTGSGIARLIRLFCGGGYFQYGCHAARRHFDGFSRLCLG